MKLFKTLQWDGSYKEEKPVEVQLVCLKPTRYTTYF